eukprot:Gb_40627 [translate_table: standard]
MAQEKLTVVAMKGHPGCGKSTIAQYLAKSLRWPLVDKDDVRDCTLPIEDFMSSITQNSSSSSLLNELSYAVIWRVAETQLKLGTSVIIDCPLSRPHLYHEAASLAARYRAHFLIVECRAADSQEWKRRLEDRARQDGSWHKPSCWEGLLKLVEGYEGCCDYDTGASKKLVVDTTAKMEEEQINIAVLRSLGRADEDTPTVTIFP